MTVFTSLQSGLPDIIDRHEEGNIELYFSVNSTVHELAFEATFLASYFGILFGIVVINDGNLFIRLGPFPKEL